MIQAMQILQLPLLDLSERIEQELMENPFLEVVEPDGEAVISRGRSTESAVIPEDDLAGLAADLDSSGLFDEDREYRGTGADLQTYTITYDGVSVVADETEIPETLASVIARLEALRP